MQHLDRRTFLRYFALGTLPLLSGCVNADKEMNRAATAPSIRSYDPSFSTLDEPARMYGAASDGGYLVPAIPYTQVDPRFYRQRVAAPNGYTAGAIVVDTQRRFLYLVEKGGIAIRYGVGIGRDGFSWTGEGIVGQRREWPRWTPPVEMLARKPGLSRYVTDEGSMAPELSNPLGARALYIFQSGKDTLYRIHGSPEWQTIGKSASSGCIRLINQDIIDLYQRTSAGARIFVT